MRVLVTGGTGLVGSQLIEDLAAAGLDPESIRVLARPSTDPTFLEAKKVQIRIGHLGDLDALSAAAEGVHTVFHCAAALDQKRRDIFWDVNFRGTVHMLEAARRAGVERFIHISSIGVYGLLHQIPATEEHPKNPLRPYAVAKLAAEDQVWKYHHTYGLKAVILRPTAVIGERDRTITRHMVNLVRRKVVPLIDGGQAQVSFIHVKDLTRAMIHSSQSEKAVGNAYNVQGFSARLRDVVEFCIEAVGSRAKIVSVPVPVAYVGALIIDGFYAVARPMRPPLRARKGIQQLTRDLVLDTTKIRADLHFEPRYGMEESFRQAIQWQLEHGH